MRRKGFREEVAYSRLGAVPRCEGWVIWARSGQCARGRASAWVVAGGLAWPPRLGRRFAMSGGTAFAQAGAYLTFSSSRGTSKDL